MSDPRYPGAVDAEGGRAGDGRGQGGDAGYGDSRARYSDPYGTPAGGAPADPSGSRRGYGGGYPAERGGDRGSYGGGRRHDQGGAGGRGYQSGGEYGAGGQQPAAGQGGYPQGGAYGAATTYDSPASGRTTYDTRSAGGGRDEVRGGRYGGQAARVASAMRRSMSSAAARGPRRARLQLKHIDPWSTLKFSLVLAVALFVVWMVAIGLLYGVLDGMGVFDKVNTLYQDVTGKNNQKIVGPGLVLGMAALIGAVNIVLFTALSTVGAFIYNMCADLVGGVEVTLSEND